ncbi:MAG: hypothetical protein ACP5KI_02025 [Brevinematia bacterium]
MKKGFVYYYVFLGFFILLVLVLGILQFIPATSLEPSYRFKYRFESFLNLLNNEERKLFVEGNYRDCAKLIDERIKQDEDFRKKIEKIKESEAIDPFSTEVMLEYFGYYLYNEVLKYNPSYKLK